MKKTLLTAIGLSCLAVASAQTSSFGLVHGVTHSWMTGNDNVKFKPGLTVGKTMIHSINEHWAVGHDVTVSFFEGVKTDGAAENLKNNLSASYVRVPVKVYHFFGELGNRVRPKIYVGASAGYMMFGDNRSIVENPDDSKTVTETKSTNYLKRWDVGLVGGAGFNVRAMKNIWLTADVTYYNGLLDVSKANSYNQNRGLGASLGITFPMMCRKPAADTKAIN